MWPRHVILDRDGVLNDEAGAGYVSDPADWRWLPGALDALRSFHQAGVAVSVVTNQSCVGRGLATREQVDRVHERMLCECAAAGGSIARVLVCPHTPDEGCDCRKPRPGLVRGALAEAHSPAEVSVLIGDSMRDLLAGIASGVQVVLVRTGKGELTETDLRDARIPVYDNVHSAAAALLGAA